MCICIGIMSYFNIYISVYIQTEALDYYSFKAKIAPVDSSCSINNITIMMFFLAFSSVSQ